MSETFKSEEQQEGWKDETSERARSLQLFLAKALLPKNISTYDSSTLHCSGNGSAFQEIQKGTTLPSSVRVQYWGEKPISVHAYYPSEKGQGIDVYLSGSVLEDFLKEV